jgi:serine phosphatase RsbU (regulator of sigma subunit)
MIDPDYSRAEYIAIEHRGSRWLSPADRAPAGGDWADIIAVSPDIVALIVGDVAGHGIGAAGIMSVLRDAIIEAVLERRIPSQVLALANSLAMATAFLPLQSSRSPIVNAER